MDRTVFLCRVKWTGLCFCAWLSGLDCVFVQGRMDRTVFLCMVGWTGLCFCAWSGGQDCVFVQG